MTNRSGSTAEGWQVKRHWFTGDKPDAVLFGPKNLAYCRRMVATLTDQHDAGDCDYWLEPVNGWSTLDGDPLLAILYHVAAGDLSPKLALAEIRELMTDRAGAGPVKGE